ncbi:hypothetical protein Glove_279g44 [Diversispora epigaea]|uniref:Uncharacterized protein n=1 Tax=Diversispora epigaea TaxID=1348612 RepID=A0A397I2A5_9GLOM|nr:hypothetical protein Glove_279g44 [Diversispora epigaea]
MSDTGEVEVIISDHEYNHFEPDTVNDDIGPLPMSISRENSNLSINTTNNNSTNNNRNHPGSSGYPILRSFGYPDDLLGHGSKP